MCSWHFKKKLVQYFPFMLILKDPLCILHYSTSLKTIIVCSLVIAYVDTGYLDHIHFSYLLSNSFWSPLHTVSHWALFPLPLHPLLCPVSAAHLWKSTTIHWLMGNLPGATLLKRAESLLISHHLPKAPQLGTGLCELPLIAQLRQVSFLCVFDTLLVASTSLYSPRQILCHRFTLKFQASLSPTSSFHLLAPSLLLL